MRPNVLVTAGLKSLNAIRASQPRATIYIYTTFPTLFILFDCFLTF